MAEMESHATDDCVGIAGGEAVPAAAVDVEIDESGNDRPARRAGSACRGTPSPTKAMRSPSVSTQPGTTPVGVRRDRRPTSTHDLIGPVPLGRLDCAGELGDVAAGGETPGLQGRPDESGVCGESWR